MRMVDLMRVDLRFMGVGSLTGCLCVWFWLLFHCGEEFFWFW